MEKRQTKSGIHDNVAEAGTSYIDPAFRSWVVSLTLVAAGSLGGLVSLTTLGGVAWICGIADEDRNWRRELMYFLHKHVFVPLHVSIGQTGWDWGMVSLARLPILVPVIGMILAVYLAKKKALPCLFKLLEASCGPECFRCGYNLTGNVSGICPECGTVIDRTILSANIQSRLGVLLPGYLAVILTASTVLPFILDILTGLTVDPFAFLCFVLALGTGITSSIAGIVVFLFSRPRLDWSRSQRRAVGILIFLLGTVPFLFFLAMSPLLVCSR